MHKSVLFIQDDAKAGLIWANLLQQMQLHVVSIDLQANLTEQFHECAFDLIIINVYVARNQGTEVCRNLRCIFTNPILYLAGGQDEYYILKTYDAGIDEFLSVSLDPQIFLAKVNAWLRHAWTISATTLDDVQLDKVHLDTGRRQVTTANHITQKLTDLEFRVLHLLMMHPGKILETKLIVDHVWGYSNSTESVLLRNVIYRLRRKIEPDPAEPVYIITVPSVGYTFHIDK